jgi:energy-coupling factor transporter ATP-binding protein EcfA2
MTFSLFSTEPIRDPAQFVGREREVVQISELLAAGRSCVVVGPEGSGKTSLLNHISQAAALVLDTPPTVIYLDLLGVRTSADFYAPLLRALGQPGEDELALGQTLASAESPPILLLLDELDRAGAGFSGLVRSALRGWVRDGRLQIVAASAESLDRAAPDLQATLLQLTLPPMPEREARSLVSELAQRASLELSASAVSDIIGVAGGYPARIQRALELWTQSEGGQTFDWRRTFREHHPEQAVLDSSLHGFAAVAETQAAEPKAASAPSRATLRERIRDSQKPQPRSYRADDPSEFLWMIILLALAIGVWWAIGSWWGVFGFAATLLGWIGIAWALVRFGGDRWRSSLYVSATRVLPLVGRFAPR